MFHKEGHKIILIFLFVVIFDVFLLEFILDDGILKTSLQLISIVILILILQFFRNPKITINSNDNYILSPVDGKVVIVEEVFEPEFFKDKRLQVSIFMSPINVHVTRYPISGKIIFSKYHPGKYLVAWHPKSSTLNERTSIVVENKTFGKILYRQIAGALANRIINYAVVGQLAVQGKDAGFIKFGSRVDLYLPIESKINIKLNEVVKGGVTIISEKS